MSFYKTALLLAALSGAVAQGPEPTTISQASSAAAPGTTGAGPAPSGAGVGGSAQAPPSSISVAAGLPSSNLASNLPAGADIP